MIIAVLGDVVARAGRDALDQFIPKLKDQYQVDGLIVNGENLAGGFGISKQIFEDLTEKHGVDAITLGNHWHKNRDVYHLGYENEKLVFPGNAWNLKKKNIHGKIITLKNGEKLGIINVLGQVFMHPENDSPFEQIKKCLEELDVKTVVVDVHCEATSEKQALAWEFAGQVSLLYGTHSHVPTLDHRILQGHTGFVTDLGMTGAYDSVIGMDIKAAVNRFQGESSSKYKLAKDNLWMPAMLCEIDADSGVCNSLKRLVYAESGVREWDPVF